MKDQLPFKRTPTEIYMVMRESSYHVAGDERSRTNPGHGYPAHDVPYTDVREFKDFESLLEWIKSTKETNYRVFKCIPMTVSKTVTVNAFVE